MRRRRLRLWISFVIVGMWRACASSLKKVQFMKEGADLYDSHIYCREYKELKDYIVDILNGEIEEYDIEELAKHIQELYDSGEMSSSQYDDLMGYVQDMAY